MKKIVKTAHDVMVEDMKKLYGSDFDYRFVAELPDCNLSSIYVCEGSWFNFFVEYKDGKCERYTFDGYEDFFNHTQFIAELQRKYPKNPVDAATFAFISWDDVCKNAEINKCSADSFLMDCCPWNPKEIFDVARVYYKNDEVTFTLESVYLDVEEEVEEEQKCDCSRDYNVAFCKSIKEQIELLKSTLISLIELRFKEGYQKVDFKLFPRDHFNDYNIHDNDVFLCLYDDEVSIQFVEYNYTLDVLNTEELLFIYSHMS